MNLKIRNYNCTSSSSSPDRPILLVDAIKDDGMLCWKCSSNYFLKYILC
jgi:hypothetical protein